MNKKNICIYIVLIILAGIIIAFLINNVRNNAEVAVNNEFTIDKFYDKDITKEYEDIRKLDEYYDKSQAQLDNCFVIGAMVHNDYLYYKFMENYKNKTDAFIRVAQNTTEGDLILYDIMYDKDEDKIFIVTDYTRDEFSKESDRIIDLKEYEAITEYTYKEHLYWVAYTGELNDTTFESNSVFKIATIN